MRNLSRLKSQSGISKVAHSLGAVIFGTVYFLWILVPPLLIGDPTQLTCQSADLLHIDCTVKYQALLRSSQQEIKDVQIMKIDDRSSSDEGGSRKYVAVLQTKS